MRYEVKSVANKTFDPGAPYSVCLNKNKEAPADDLTVTFPINEKVDELTELTVYLGENLFFCGIIDEQKTISSNEGTFLQLTARSKVAYLLDNEALPATYFLPSLDLIFKKNIEPYGFKGILGNKQRFSTQFVITKGMSEWEVLEQFCVDYLKVYPRVTAEGIIDASEDSKSNFLKFSNRGKGIKYSSFYENIKHCDMISKVCVMAQKDGSYSTEIADEEAVQSGIVRKRYLNALNTEKTATISGEIFINNAKQKAYEVGIVCSGAVHANVGDKACINDILFGKFENLYVSSVNYTLNKSAEQTEITLCRG